MKDFDFYLNQTEEIGFVEQIRSTIAYINGLPSVRPQEMVIFENGITGQVLSISPHNCEILVFSRSKVAVGSRVVRTGNFLEIPLSLDLLGKVVDPLCHSLDKNVVLKEGSELRTIDNLPLGINSRRKIKNNLETGVTLVDLLVPIGKGQRELVIGDRKTGKTTFLRQTVVNQSLNGTICVYAAIGKKMADIKELESYFQEHQCLKNIVIVATNSQDPPGITFLTPYTAMTIAEYFRDLGNDVLVVLDDLTTHAKFYREISLLARRFPGRESYPGDIFYVHSRLLERAGNFFIKEKEVSITCLPVAESLEGDITGYIQTNIMSITDGHVFFDNDRFIKGQRPAINPFLSVTRVGSQTQSQVRKDIHREIMSVLNLYEKSENFIHFSSTLIESTKLSLNTGERILKFLSQESSQRFPTNVQTILFSMMWLNYWQDSNEELMPSAMFKIATSYLEDKSISTLFDELINSSENFNVLLGKMEQNKSKFIKLIS